MSEQVHLSSAVSRFLDAVRSTVAPATFALYERYLTSFKAAVGDVALSSITPAMVAAWNPRYHPVGCVRRLMRWCVVDARLIAVNPLDGMTARRNGHRLRILSPLEASRLLRRADRTFRRFLVAMRETIARPREIRGVRWADVRTCGSPAWTVTDLAAGRCFFRLVRFKGQELRRDRLAVRNIPISRRLGRLLVRLWGAGREAAAAIFVNRLRRAWTCNAIRCRMRRLRAAAELPADADGENVVAYSLRHTSATDAVGAGIKGLVLAELMGHSDVRMTQRYVHLRPDHLLEAMGRLEEWKTTSRAKNDRLGSSRTSADGSR